MRLDLKEFLILFFTLFLIIGNMGWATAEDVNTRAKIGVQIKSGDSITRAKSWDNLKKGDLLRIYIHPEKTCHVYVIHTDQENVTLLNMVQQKYHSSTLVMPSLQEFYQVDGKSALESFTIIISPDNLTEILDFFKAGNTQYSKWVEIEKNLLEKGKIDLSQETQKPFSISGNVRGTESMDNIDPFVSQLQIFTGKSMLVKKYDFRVQKP